MSDTPPPGSSEWWPGSDSDDPTTWEPQPAFTVQRRVAGVTTGGDYVRGSTSYTLPAYLTATVGTISTPDPGPLPKEAVMIVKVRISSGFATSTEYAVAQMQASGTYGFRWQSFNGDLYYQATNDGLGFKPTKLASVAQLTAAGIVPDADVTIAMSIDLDNGANQTAGRAYVSLNNGASWTPLSAEVLTAGALVSNVDLSLPLTIGAWSTAQSNRWMGRIYSAELRTGLDPVAGTVLWRFDANDYPGTGTTYTDPRGRIWTLTSASAITAPVVVGPDVPQAALRFPTSADLGIEEMVGTGIFYARPLDYGTIEITWGITLDLAKWNEIAVVRSAMGFPATVNEGQTIFRATQAKLFPQGYTTTKDKDGKRPIEARKLYDPRDMPGVGTQVTLPGGFWYYYTLFFRSGTKWHKYMVTSAVLPRNYHHAEHLFNNLPPYYQWIDDNMRGGAQDGDLRKFLTLIGYDLDLTREYVQGWLDLYHTDFTPVPLLRRLGANFGVPYEAGIGDIRYRGLISKIGFLYRSRGTTRGLQEMVVSVTKCSAEITPSANIMLLPDDSDFFEGTGSWAGIHPETPLTGLVITNPLEPSKVRLEYGLKVTTPPKPENTGRGMMRLFTTKADATRSLFITCGDGIAQVWGLVITLEVNSASHAQAAGIVLLNGLSVDNSTHAMVSVMSTLPSEAIFGVKTFYPRYVGIPVVPLEIYSFSVQVKVDVTPTTGGIVILWFNENGDSQDVVGNADLGPGPINDTNWHTYLSQGPAPAAAAYAVPGIYFTARPAGTDPDYSPSIYLCAAQFSRIGTTATVAASSPDRYLTLGEDEKIGPPSEAPPFEGYLIGDPTP